MTVVTLHQGDVVGIHDVCEAGLSRRDKGRTSLIPKNVRVNGVRTSMRLEAEFWEALHEVARLEGRSMADVCSQAVKDCPGSATSATRVYVLKRLTGVG